MRDIDMGKAYERRTPRSLPGLQIWLDARNGLFQDVEGATPVTADGQVIALQKNRAGTAYGDFTQATTGKRPTYGATSVNGWPGVVCDEEFPKHLVRLSGPTLVSGDATFAFVYDADEATGTLQLLFQSQSGPLQLYHLTSTDGQMGFVDADASVKNVAAAAAGPQIVLWHFSGTTATLYRNGVSLGSQTYAPTTASGGVGVGGSYLSGAGAGLDGKIGDALVYNRALAPDEITWLSNFLNTRYGGNIF